MTCERHCRKTRRCWPSSVVKTPVFSRLTGIPRSQSLGISGRFSTGPLRPLFAGYFRPAFFRALFFGLVNVLNRHAPINGPASMLAVSSTSADGSPEYFSAQRDAAIGYKICQAVETAGEQSFPDEYDSTDLLAGMASQSSANGPALCN